MGSFEFSSEKLPPSAASGKIPPRIEGQLNSHAAINNAHHFFNTGGAEVHALARPLLVPGANEPISPIIQMIMRLPGHVGLLNSFFEALQSMILPHVNLLPGFDPSIFGVHIHDAANAAVNSVGGHPHIDMSLLPSDAPILQSLQLDGSALAGQMHTHLSGADLIKHSLNVSGTPDIGKPVYEGAGQPALDASAPTAAQSGDSLAGPALSDHGTSNHLAGAHRVFSHSLFEKPGSGMNSPLSTTAQNTPATNSPINQPNLLPQQHSGNSMLNVNGSPFSQPSTLPAAGDFSSIYRTAMNAGYHMGAPGEQALSGSSPLGPSGAVSDQLGSRHVLASDQGVETFRPTVGDNSSAYDASSLQESGSASQPLTGLRARQLSLDGGGKLAHSSSHFRGVSGDANTNGQSHLDLVKKPLSNAKDQIAHRVNSKAYSTSNQIASLPKHAHPADHAIKHIKPASSLAKNSVSEATPSADSTQANISDRPTSYTIRSGDCLWNIAKNQLGDAKQWQDIYKLNADTLGSNPDLIHPGTTIQLPNASQDLASHGMNAGKYVVRAGDNLWDISKHLMGSGEKWGQLYHLNSDVIGANPRLILPGQELTLPGSDVVASNSAAPMTEAAGLQQPIDNHMAETLTAPQTSVAQPTPQPSAEAPASEAPASVSYANPPAAAPVEAPRSVLSGPGGAQAATLTPAPSQNDPSVVSPSLAPDLSFFANGKK